MHLPLNRDDRKLKVALEAHNTYHYFNAGQNALPVDSMGNFWNGSYVNATGNLKLDLVHNFFLELNARATKLKVYETTDNPTVREQPSKYAVNVVERASASHRGD